MTQKLFLVVCILTFIESLFLSTDFILAQNPKAKILKGYKNLEWGSSLEMVRTEYPKIRQVEKDDLDFPNTETYAVNYEEGTIDKRTFIIWKNALVKVIVDYNRNETDLKTLTEAFDEEYGEVDSFDANTVYIDGGTTRIIEGYRTRGNTKIIVRTFVRNGFNSSNHAIYLSLRHKEMYDKESKKPKPDF